MGQTELMRIGVELSFSRSLVAPRQNITFTNLYKGDRTR